MQSLQTENKVKKQPKPAAGNYKSCNYDFE